MKKLLALALLLSFSAPTWAQVSNGATYTNAAGETVTFHISLNPTMGDADVWYTDPTGDSPEVVGTPSQGGGPVVDSAPPASTWGEPGPNGEPNEGGRYRVSGGKAQEQTEKGTWKSMKPKPEPTPKPEDAMAGGAGTSGTLPDDDDGGGGPPAMVKP